MIIPQKFINDANKILKDAFCTALQRVISPKIWSVLNSFSNAEQALSIIKLNDSLKEVAIQALEIAIPQIDKLFLNSRYRKTYFYKAKTNHKNRIFLFGELSYERYYYTDKNKKNGFYLIDELFNFEKYTIPLK